jgi:cytidyltransferase-like protein
MVKEAILEQKSGETVAILPGKFKPPHRGHLDMIKHYAGIADRVVVLVSPKEKDGITADSSVQILNMYLDDANVRNADVEIAQFASPVRAAMEYGNLPEMEGTKIILGASTKGGDAAERFAGNVQKYVENAEVLNPLDYAFDPVGEVLSATDFRNALRTIDNIERFLPDTSKDKAESVIALARKNLKEANDPFLGIFRGLVEEVLQERAESEKQRKWACAQMGKSRKKFKGKPSLSKKEAEKMCTDPLKEEELEEISAMGEAAVAGYAGPIGKPKRRNPSENEVNEALNYLLQKLGV